MSHDVPRQLSEPSREYKLRYEDVEHARPAHARLTTLAVVIGELLFGALGVGYNLAGPHHLLARAFAVAFAVGAIAPMLLVRAEHAWSSVIATPLCYAFFVLIAAAVAMTGSGSLLQRLAEEAAMQALYSAPGLFFATGGTALIAVVKTITGRGRQRRPHSGQRLAGLDASR